jgi:hypothetical protein
MTAAVNPTSQEAFIATFNQPRTAESNRAESVQTASDPAVTQMRNQIH